MVKKLVKFYPSVMDELDKKTTYSIEDYDTVKYIYNILIKNKYIITIDDLKELIKLGKFDLEKHVYCYLNTMIENKELVKFDVSFLDYIDELIKGKRTKGSTEFSALQVRRLISKRQGNYIKKIYYRRIEYLLEMDLNKYIKSSIVVGNKINIRATQQQYESIVYMIARILSDNYNYGYAIDYEHNCITINKVVKFYWKDKNMYYKKKCLFEFDADINNMCKIIDEICCQELFKSM